VNLSRLALVLAVLIALHGARPAMAATPPSSRRPAPLAGHWQGQWVRDGSSLDVWVDFSRSDSGYVGSFGSDALRVLDIPFRSVRSDSAGVHWQIVGDVTTSNFDGTLAGDELNGAFRDGDAPGTFRLRRTAQSTAPPYSSEEARFANGDVTLVGTLLMPAGPGPHPAILFVHGSGAEGRYASRYLADRFARAGFAALIYDKRGVGASGGDWRRATFDDLAGDALAAIHFLAGDPRVRAGAIGLWGNSQGGMIAPLIASQSKDLGFVIASAGGAVPLMEAERYSYRNFLGLPRMHGADSVRAESYVDAVVRTAYEGGPWERADSAAQANAKEKWFMGIPGRDDSFWWMARRTADYDAPSYWRRVKAPVFLIYGEEDGRVPVKRSLENIRAALGAGGNNDVAWKVYAGSDHTIRINQSDDGHFHWPRTPAGYPDTLITWARSKARGH
jgi:alpha-beta hydrolase superfamily lysophospholipase